jgi:rubredoxin
MENIEVITRYNVICPSCESKFSFLKGDINAIIVDRDIKENGIPSNLICPVCGQVIPIWVEYE